MSAPLLVYQENLGIFPVTPLVEYAPGEDFPIRATNKCRDQCVAHWGEKGGVRALATGA